MRFNTICSNCQLVKFKAGIGELKAASDKEIEEGNRLLIFKKKEINYLKL
jgi:hypothetical protein